MLKKTRIPITAVVLLLSFMIAFSIQSAAADATTYLKTIDIRDGDTSFEFPASTPINTTFIANITVTDVYYLATWQINITWDPTLLKINSTDDLTIPPDNVFGEYVDGPFGLTIKPSSVFCVAGIKLGAPSEYINGSGTLCQIQFTILKNDTGGPLFCDIPFVLAGQNLFYTKLINPDADLISYETEDGYYIIPEFPMVILPLLFLITTLLALILWKKTSPEKRQRYSSNIQAVR